jgi:hypothetical protein
MKSGVWMVVMAVLACSAASAATPQRTPPGSFLRYRATTVQELVNQMRQDPVVRARYAKHFKTSPNTLASDVSHGVRLITLKSPARVTSFYISKSGRISGKRKLLSRGTLVFADSAGKPVIAWSCGNPLTTALARHVVKQPVQVTEEVKPTVEVISAPVEVAEAPSNPPELTAAAFDNATPGDTVEVAPEEVAVAPAEPLAVVTAPEEYIPADFAATDAIAGAALVLPAIAVLASSHNVQREIKPQIAVPEPGAAVALITGLLATAGWSIRRRRVRCTALAI